MQILKLFGLISELFLSARSDIMSKLNMFMYYFVRQRHKSRGIIPSAALNVPNRTLAVPSWHALSYGAVQSLALFGSETCQAVCHLSLSLEEHKQVNK